MKQRFMNIPLGYYDFDYNSDLHLHQGAIIVGNYKLIVGPQENHCDSIMYCPLDYRCIIVRGQKVMIACDPYCMCLYS